MQTLIQLVQSDAVKYAAETVTVCSVLHSVLPPFDWKPDFVEVGLADFPLAQKAFYSVFNSRWYKLAIYVIGYIALNARTTLWRSLSSKNPKSANFAPVTKSEQPASAIPESGKVN